MSIVRPDACPAATAVAAGDIFLIDGATGVRALAATAVPKVAVGKTAVINNSLTFAGVDGKTLTANNSLTLAGTDGTTQTFQASDTIVGRATTDTLTNKTIAGALNTLTVRAASDVTGTLPVVNGGTNYTGGAWTAFTATVVPGAGAITTQSSASSFMQIGKLVHVRIAVTISAIGTASGTMTVNLPGGTTLAAQQSIPGRESGISGQILTGTGASGASSLAVFINATANPTYTNGMIVALSGIYEAT
jgi:hypothetical protein